MKRLLAALTLTALAVLTWSYVAVLGEGSANANAPDEVQSVAKHKVALDAPEIVPFVSRRESVARTETRATDAQAMTRFAVRLRVVNYSKRAGFTLDGLSVRLGVGVWNHKEWGNVIQGRRVLTTVEVDESGELLLDFEIPSELFEVQGPERPALWAVLDTSGWQQQLARRVFPADLSEPIQITVRAKRGMSVHGSVRDNQGAPAYPCDVLLCKPAKLGFLPKELVSAKTSRDGEFTLHYTRAGEFALHASASQMGTVTREGVVLKVDESGRVDLVLRGSGRISGRVFGPDDKPYPNYRLWILPDAKREETGGSLGKMHKVASEWEGGLADTRVSTDGDGRFSCSGLKPGSYVIRGLTAPSGGYGELLTEEAVTTDALDLTLSAGGYRLIVHVFEQGGEILKGVRFSHSLRKELYFANTLYCVECDPSGRVLNLGREAMAGRSTLEDGSIVVPVERGKSYIVGVVSKDRPLCEQIVHIPYGAPVSECSLYLQEPSAQGALTVRILKVDGTPFYGKRRVRVYGVESQSLLLSTEDSRGVKPFSAELGPGRYRIQVEPDCTMRRLRDDEGALIEEVIEVFPGSRRVVDLRLARRGGIELTVNSEVEFVPGDLSSQLAAELTWMERRRATARGIGVTLIPRIGQLPVVPIFDLSAGTVYEGKPSASLYGLERLWILFDKRATTVTPIPIGEYELILTPPGFREVRQQITVEEGQTTKLEFTLTQRDLLD